MEEEDRRIRSRRVVTLGDVDDVPRFTPTVQLQHLRDESGRARGVGDDLDVGGRCRTPITRRVAIRWGDGKRCVISSTSSSEQIADRHFEFDLRWRSQPRACDDALGVDLDGRPFSLGDYRGKVVLVSFWATWCYSCMKAIPHERALLERFGPERFAIVGVNVDEDPGVAKKAVAEYGVPWRSFRSPPWR